LLLFNFKSQNEQVVSEKEKAFSDLSIEYKQLKSLLNDNKLNLEELDGDNKQLLFKYNQMEVNHFKFMFKLTFFKF